MAKIAPLNIASGTAPNWLKEAQDSLAAAENPGGLMGALQNSKTYKGSIKSYLANSQRAAANMALIGLNSIQAIGSLTAQIASAAIQKRVAEKLAAAQKLNAPQTNYNPPTTLDPVIYFGDGSTLDTSRNIITFTDGTQIDSVTGQKYIEPGSLIQMANGAYLDTKNNILTLSDGTKIDTVTHLVITV